MKIIKIRFKNLNSLRSEFEIPFDEGPLNEAGLFAITGPTGAGKSTILDAICVALYGQTPRLGPIGPSSEELMSRHTINCYSEVEFRVKSGTYCSRWARHRSRGKVEGKLQPAQMELSQIDGPQKKIIESSKAEVPKTVERLTGLDFKRFTRTIMLSQGRFAEFLNAEENDRAFLLERMTGTEIYGALSATAFQMAKERIRAYEELLRDEGKLEIMDSEQLEERKKDNKRLTEAIEVGQAKLKQLEEHKNWKKNLKTLEFTVKSCQEELVRVAKERELAKPQMERLLVGKKALPLNARFTALEKQQQEIASLNQEMVALEQRIAGHESNLSRQTLQKEEEILAFERFRKTKEQKEQQIALAEQKDHQVQREMMALQEKQNLLKGVQDRLAQVLQEKNGVETTIVQLMQGIEESQTFLTGHAKDQDLEKELPVLQEWFVQLQKNRQERLGLQGEMEKNKNVVQNWNEYVQNLEKDVAAQGEKQKARQIEQQQQEAQLQEFLQGKTIETWEDEERLFEKRGRDLDQLVELGQSIVELEKKRGQLHEQMQGVERNIATLQQQQRQQSQELTEAEVLLGQLQEKQKLELLIAKYEEDRQQLHKGEPCPLCGGVEHPWQESGPPDLSGTDAVIKSQTKKIKKIQKQLETLSNALAEGQAEMRQFQNGQKEMEVQSQQFLESWETQRKVVEWEGLAQDWQQVQTLQADNEKNWDAHQKQVFLIKNLRKTIDLLVAESLREEQAHANLRVKHQEAIADKDKASQVIQQWTEQIESLTTTIQEQEKNMAAKLTSFDQALPIPGEEGAILESLQQRSRNYQFQRQKHEEQEKQLLPCRENKQGLEAQIQSMQERELEEQKNVTLVNNQLTQLRAERHELLGTEKTDEARMLLKRQQDQQEAQLKSIESQLVTTRSELQASQGVLGTTQQRHQYCYQEWEQDYKFFETELEKAGFVDLQQFHKSILAPEEIEALEERKTRLEAREIQASTRMEDIEKLLGQEQKKALTKDSVEALVEKIDHGSMQLETTRQTQHQIQIVLQQQEQLRLQKADLMEQIEQQKKECWRWKELDRLIGSDNGMKFRRFAQGLTLDHLIGLANSRLSKFNERYILVRSRSENLGLEVIDGYQANVTRSVKSLSGGESFLVSLALALGLSNLVSRNISIDSLFLDEGFGTLDEEALEMALVALENLNASGKTIGVISHVEALKERITTQIQVTQLSEGVSRLQIVAD